ncbi:MAG TPA: hypothetical protein VNO52_14470 [Methylomirabilota bacterium]|nr:hypothetical protein [Methylomirabilota bacterium]
MNDLAEMKREGLSVQAICELTGYDPKTVRKYLLKPEAAPRYAARLEPPGKLDEFKPYLTERLKAGVWNARVLLRELKQHGYRGGYTILKDWLQPQRTEARAVAVRRFETPPGKQAQADWGHLGHVEVNGRAQRIWGFAHHARLQSQDVGRGSAGSETRHSVTHARGRLRRVGRCPGRDSLRPHEDRVAGHRRTW